jgi:hypothetical protein
MPDHAIEQLLRNIDSRATRIAQLLPAMSTKKELLEAIDNTTSKLATKAEMREANDAVRADVRLLTEQVLAMRRQLDENNLDRRPPQNAATDRNASNDPMARKMPDELSKESELGDAGNSASPRP